MLANHAARLGFRSDALAMVAVLAQPWADVVLNGAVNLDQLNSNLAASGVRWDQKANQLLGACRVARQILGQSCWTDVELRTLASKASAYSTGSGGRPVPFLLRRQPEFLFLGIVSLGHGEA
jgi:hypothetical protein